MEEALYELINAEPFHPFKVIMTSGHEYTVTDPMLIAVGKTDVFFFYGGKSDKRANLRKNQIAVVETTDHSEKRNR